jgi:hypothetical protein
MYSKVQYIRLGWFYMGEKYAYLNDIVPLEKQANQNFEVPNIG